MRVDGPDALIEHWNNAPRNVYITRYRRRVAVSASATSVAQRVLRLIGDEEITCQPWFDTAGERAARGAMLDALVQNWIGGRDLDDAGAAIVPIYDVSHLLSDPHVQRREVVTTVQDEDLGPLRMLVVRDV